MLVVDDTDINRQLFEDITKHWGMEPTVVASGAAAIEELRSSARRDRPFDVILLDHLKPIGDDCPLGRKRREPYENCVRPISQ